MLTATPKVTTNKITKIHTEKERGNKNGTYKSSTQ